MIKAIFFDFNGVVIDDEPIQLLAYQEVLKAEDITIKEEEYYASLGMSDESFLRAVFDSAGRKVSDETLWRLIEAKTAAYTKMIEKDLPLFPGVVTFVKAASRQFSIGIVSMARRVEIDGVLNRAKLAPLFEVVVSSEDVKTYKPDPACYLRGLSLLNEKLRGDGKPEVFPKECLVVEDAPAGIKSGRAAGMRSLGITNTVSSEALRTSGADVVSKSLFDWTVDAVRLVFSVG